MGEYGVILAFIGVGAFGIVAIMVGLAFGFLGASKESREWRALAQRRGWKLDGTPRFKGEINWKKQYGPQKVPFDLNSFSGADDSAELPQTNFDVYGLDLRGARCAILSEQRLQDLERQGKSSGLLAAAMVGQVPQRFQFDPDGCTKVAFPKTLRPGRLIMVVSDGRISEVWSEEVAKLWCTYPEAQQEQIELICENDSIRLSYRGEALQTSANLERFADLGLAIVRNVENLVGHLPML